MPYDLFISYARRDNERGQVSALNAQIESRFRAFAGRDLQVFFDSRWNNSTPPSVSDWTAPKVPVVRQVTSSNSIRRLSVASAN